MTDFDNKPIRVAQIMGKMVGGGVESVVMNYYRNIDHSEIQFDFVVDQDSTRVPRSEIESLGGKIFIVPPYQQVVKYQKTLVNLFRQEKWPIVHSHVNALSVFPLRAAKKAGVLIRIAHSHSTAGQGEYIKNVAKGVLKIFSKVYPTHRLACSRYAGNWLFGKEDNFDVMYNAIDLGRFAYNPKTRAQTRADLGLEDDEFAIGHVGRFMPQKNHGFLIDAFAEIARFRDDVVLLLVGDGESKASAEKRVADCGIMDKVKFLGQRDDIGRIYQAFDVFALPSLYEGLGLVAIEAQMAGLPCVLSDAITREVDVTGACEFLSIEDPRGWAEALVRVADATKRDRALHDVETYFDDYDIKKASPRLGSYYEKLTAEPHRGGVS